MRIPEHELSFTFARSGGPGGQNVNKVESKVQLRWNLEASPSFSDEEKLRLRTGLASFLTQTGDVLIESDETRSQLQNRETVVARLETLVTEALKPIKKRKPTKPSRAQKAKRLDAKKQQSQKKSARRPPSHE